MAFAESPRARPQADAPPLPLLVRLHDWVVTVDHKRLGIMYICTGLLFFAVGGLEASIMRWQLAVPNHDVVAPEVFNAFLDLIKPTLRQHIDWRWFIASQVAFGLLGGFVIARSEQIETMQTWPMAARAGLETHTWLPNRNRRHEGEELTRCSAGGSDCLWPGHGL